MDDDPGAGVYTPFAKAFLKFVRVIIIFFSFDSKEKLETCNIETLKIRSFI